MSGRDSRLNEIAVRLHNLGLPLPDARQAAKDLTAAVEWDLRERITARIEALLPWIWHGDGDWSGMTTDVVPLDAVRDAVSLSGEGDG